MNIFDRKRVQVEEAQRMLLAASQPAAVEYVPLGQSINRRLAADVTADTPLPHFPRSGLDGYALLAEDVRGAVPDQPVELRVIGEAAAGGLFRGRVSPGEAVRVMTGAAVPEGATAVVMLEQTASFERGGRSFVQIRRPAALGQHIAPIGEEIAAGQRLILRGTRIQPGHIALLAAFGIVERVPVYALPKTVVFATGSELLAPADALAAGLIRNSNSPMVCAQALLAGAEAHDGGILPDDPEAAHRSIRAALRDYDLVITTGGVSVGDYDAMACLFSHHPDFQLLFNKVAMRPGSPTSAAIVDGKPVIGLSGNPGACFVGFELFAKPLLRRMQGAPQAVPVPLEAVLASSYDKGAPFDRFVRARLTFRSGAVEAHPLGFGKSGMMVSIPEADGLIVIPAGERGASKGEAVNVIPLGYTSD